MKKYIKAAEKFGNIRPNEMHLLSELVSKDYEFVTDNLPLVKAVGHNGRSYFKPGLGVTTVPATKTSKQTIALVGKGITMDTGGADIKTHGSMGLMHLDKTGAAIVFGLLEYFRENPLKNISIHGILCLAYNAIGPGTYLTSSVIESRKGDKVLIRNTDAEGRLVLADGITVAKELGSSLIIDIASLTGAMDYALGSGISGVFGTKDRVRAYCEVADETKDLVHPLPIADVHRKDIKSSKKDDWDIANSGKDSSADGSLAAAFLENFYGNTEFIHIDTGAVSFENDYCTIDPFESVINYLKLLDKAA